MSKGPNLFHGKVTETVVKFFVRELPIGFKRHITDAHFFHRDTFGLSRMNLGEFVHIENKCYEIVQRDVYTETGPDVYGYADTLVTVCYEVVARHREVM